ncbi:uncharacterized protein F5891DRAFT_1130757 [Suillus fuscotomentosus]|uniref:C2H2-type domain-containing protein n=1 Tax=Suillus fuscotomentosus TaxID=1912939 RepID=A0AAD4DW50_9AGAM|nr:uncharacterized protein F5891DRAFT_1130757 [Suillus fuscotomentosus]KAG1894965.1 hypothetical protein F5891DRAFT_1130757 [Suillus fuscotomentosus]
MAPKINRLVCQFPNFKRVFRNKSGLTQHIHAKHPLPPQTQEELNRMALPAGPGFIPPRQHSPTQAENQGIDEQDDTGFVPEEGTWVDMGRLFQTFHPHMTGCKCDVNGTFIDQDAPPLPRTDTPSTDWMPYNDRVEFETAEFLFTCNQMSTKQIDTLLDLWAVTLIKHNDAPPFANHKNIYATIDATPLGDVPWKMFSMCFNGIKPEQNVPPWMNIQYDVWYRDPLQIVCDMLANPAFNGASNIHRTCDYTSDWAWNQVDLIAENQETYGLMFVPLIIGSDKTVVSVATGQTEYHLLYISIGNIHNSVQCAHHRGIVLIGFLAIPKSTKEYNNDTNYRNFRRQLFQQSLAKIFESVKPFMETPNITCFPDGHFRRTIYGLGPYIADYPEQVLLSGILQNWCPRCLANSKDLDGGQPCLHQCKAHTELLIEQLTYRQVWQEYGTIGDLIIKGTFKDHLVDWVENYLNITHGARHAAKIMDDIDRRIAAVAPFTGLWCFPDRHGFQQWTGDDSKALMKVHTFGAFLNFCYLVQHEALTKTDLHIKALKEPWHRSSRFKALGQMLLTNQHLDKLAAALTDFEAHDMLHGSCLSEALRENQSVEVDAGDILDGPTVIESHIELAVTPHFDLNLPCFPLMIQEFIHDQQHSDDPNPPEYDPATAQLFLGKLTIFNSAAASFYAPSDLSGTGGMHWEHIRATPSWCGGPCRNDCIFINMGANLDSPMGGLAVAWVLCFFSFSNWTSHYPCTVVHWYSHVLEGRDPDTGMYVVTPTTNNDDTPDVSIIHVDCIFHATHHIPVYGLDFIPIISLHDSYNMFNSYYVNKYADHHSFEIA